MKYFHWNFSPENFFIKKKNFTENLKKYWENFNEKLLGKLSWKNFTKNLFRKFSGEKLFSIFLNSVKKAKNLFFHFFSSRSQRTIHHRIIICQAPLGTLFVVCRLPSMHPKMLCVLVGGPTLMRKKFFLFFFESLILKMRRFVRVEMRLWIEYCERTSCWDISKVYSTFFGKKISFIFYKKNYFFFFKISIPSNFPSKYQNFFFIDIFIFYFSIHLLINKLIKIIFFIHFHSMRIF